MDEEAKEAEKTKAPQDSKEGKATEDKTETEIKAGENPKETQVQNIPPASPPISAEPSATTVKYRELFTLNLTPPFPVS